MTEAQAAQLLELVSDIRNLLVAVVAQEPAETVETCPHPEDARVEFSTPSDRDHWVCGICRFDNKAVA